MVYFKKSLIRKDILEKLEHKKGKEHYTRAEILKAYGNFRVPKETELKIRKCKACKVEYLPEKSNYTLCPKCYIEYQYAYHAKYKHIFMRQQIKGKPYLMLVYCEVCSDPHIIPKSHFKLKSHICKSCTESGKRNKRVAVNLQIRKKKLNSISNKCEVCGNEELDILQVHHKNRDSSNNDVSNLQALCPNCHRKEHVRH